MPPLRCPALFALFPLLLGCGAGAASPESPAPVPAQASAAPPAQSAPEGPTGAPSEAAAPRPGASAEPPASAPPGDAPAKAAPAPSESSTTASLPPLGMPLSAEEQREADRTCKPLQRALLSRKARGEANQREILDKVLEKPPAMPKPALERCAALLRRVFEAYDVAAMEVEARTLLAAMSRAMVGVYRQTGSFCPSAPAIPASREAVAKAPYVSTSADWSAPPWACLGLDLAGQSQRFQYEVRTDAAARTFEIVARGAPLGDGRFVELFTRGVVKPSGVEVSPPARR